MYRDPDNTVKASHVQIPIQSPLVYVFYQPLAARGAGVALGYLSSMLALQFESRLCRQINTLQTFEIPPPPPHFSLLSITKM